MKDIIPAKKQSPILGLSGMGGGVGSNLVGRLADKLYIDDVFSNDRWHGNSSIRTITNGVDLLGEGGAVFIKGTDIGSEWVVGDNIQGDDYYMSTNNNAARSSDSAKFRQRNNNGFTIGADSSVNNSSYEYLGFSFRKQKKFFDIVSFTGTGAVQSIPHNLGSVPGMMIIKSYSVGGRDWNVYHRHNYPEAPQNYRLRLDSDAVRTGSAVYFNNTAPTATHFTVGTSGDINESGTQFVAYLFAHNEAVYGENSDEPLIFCGGYTGTGSNIDLNMGFEPSFFMVKRVDGSGDWVVSNTLHAYGKDNTGTNPTDAKTTNMNETNVMTTTAARISQYPNGIRIRSESQSFLNQSGSEYIYLAVRSSVGLVAKAASAGTEVFDTGTANNSGGACPPGSWEKGFEVDFVLHKNRSSTDDWEGATRKTGEYRWFVNTTGGLPSSSSGFQWDSSTGMGEGISGSNTLWGWKRGRGFDVQFNRNEGAGTYNHNLGQVPEMIWVGNINQNDWKGAGHHKLRTADPWNYVAYMNNDSIGNAGSGYWNNTAPTATQFTVGNNGAMSAGGIIYMLWCSVPGICKIDDYNGDGGTSNAINCGFQPRYVMIKRVDSSGGWKIWDYSRGTNSIMLNANAAQSNEPYVSFTSSGFTLIDNHATVNASGGRYIYHAQA